MNSTLEYDLVLAEGLVSDNDVDGGYKFYDDRFLMDGRSSREKGHIVSRDGLITSKIWSMNSIHGIYY